jgi:RNA polymerase sigma-70 factor (ECF subfamily)
MLTSASRCDSAIHESQVPERFAPPTQQVGSPVAGFSAHTPALLARALFLTRTHADAWDLVQDTLERALRRQAPSSQPELRRWLFVVMHHLHLDRCRHAQRHRSIAVTDDVLVLGLSSENPEPSWSRLGAADVQECLAQLDPRLREAYVLHAERGLRLTDIAEQLGVPLSTVGTRVFRARRRLRVLLGGRAAEPVR